MSGSRSRSGSGSVPVTTLPVVLPGSSGSRPGSISPPTSPRGTRRSGSGNMAPFIPAGSTARSRSPSPPRSIGNTSSITLPGRPLGTTSPRFRSPSPPGSLRGSTGYYAGSGTTSPRSSAVHASPAQLIGGTPVPMGPSIQPIRATSHNGSASHHSHNGTVLPTSSPSYKPHKVRGLASPTRK